MSGRGYSQGTILRFWAPLAAQWLMMGIEGPFLAAVIARLDEPAFNLAAYGVAYAFGILVESPVIMLMTASTALVRDAPSYRRLRTFAHLLNAFATLLLLLILIPPVFGLVFGTALDLPEEVRTLVYGALWLLLPWPAAIGYRRFLHGVMIRDGQTRRVAYGTLLRLASMAAAAVLLARTGMHGAWVGAAALSAGVLAEALAATWMARGAVRRLQEASPSPRSGTHRAFAEPQTVRDAGAGADVQTVVEAAGPGAPAPAAPGYRDIARFYYPLALTSLIGLTVQPLLTFFMGRAPAPVHSLALFPVVNSLSFLFRTLGLSYQEAAVALLGPRGEHGRELGRFAAALAVASSGALALVAFTPLAEVWFRSVSGLSPELATLALVPTRAGVLLPALSVVLSFQRAVLVQRRTTRLITLSTLIEVLGIAVLFPVFGWGMGVTGVTAAMLALLGGRIAGVLFLNRRALGG